MVPVPPVIFGSSKITVQAVTSNSNALITAVNLSPPRFARPEVCADDIRIQLDSESGLVRHGDEAVFYIWSVKEQHLVHPAALAGDGFERDVIADRRGPLHRGVCVDLTAGVVVRHRQSEDVRHVG